MSEDAAKITLGVNSIDVCLGLSECHLTNNAIGNTEFKVTIPPRPKGAGPVEGSEYSGEGFLLAAHRHCRRPVLEVHAAAVGPMPSDAAAPHHADTEPATGWQAAVHAKH